MAYQPPKQSLAGQIVDVEVLLVLTVGALYVPTTSSPPASTTTSVGRR